MSKFDKGTKEFAKNVAHAAAWMERRYDGSKHWWKSWVLTERHTSDPDGGRPVFDPEMAQAIFKNLNDRGLLAGEDINGDKFPTDEPGEPVFYINFDREGWDKAVSDGRPIYGRFRKLRRSWHILLLGIAIGLCIDTIKDMIKDKITAGIEKVEQRAEKAIEASSKVKHREEKKAGPLPEMPKHESSIRALDKSDPKSKR
ncbi:hypothetical protein SAMN05444166_1421 [Singulisphaera sp. GP187]|uniref:hypothetical protein n=1 Tax=Singulisphaera sp. GP187 TaxID=1882752 RepID=UPI00092887B2|nr:hypothetical protein [Singulisphaera sp. GP187]SIN88175.1 hypothetical protein SAMN05444166_1421 [Singulisphaera sp. GP187]